MPAALPGVTVLDIEQPSKPAALNAGDAAATLWPRIYLQMLTWRSVRTRRGPCWNALAPGGPRAARPAVKFDPGGAHPLIHAYYGTKHRLPLVRRGLWSGGGLCAVRTGPAAVPGPFPDLIADDLFVDRLFRTVPSNPSST